LRLRRIGTTVGIEPEDAMSRILTLFLVLHWAVAFSLLAALVIMSGEGTLLTGFGALSNLTGPGSEMLSGMAVRGAVGFGFSVCALLFWWSFVSVGLAAHYQRSGDDTLKVAFAAATVTMTAILVLGTFKGASGLFPTVAAHFAALIASYLATRMDQQPASQLVANNDHRVAVRVKAMQASHSARMARFVTNRQSTRSFDR
jgi:hypothetical protein